MSGNEGANVSEVFFLCVWCSDCVQWLKQEEKREGGKEKGGKEGVTLRVRRAKLFKPVI